MSISPYPLSSNPKIKVHFRTPTVDDAISIAELSPDFDESIANQYLRDIQDIKKNKGGQVFDPEQWTIEDRKLALMWIFVQSREDHLVPLSYECKHCNQRHYVDIDITDIMETATTIQGKPTREIEFRHGDETMQATVKPINGAESELLEQLRLDRDEYGPDTTEYRARNINLKMVEHACLIRLPNEPDDSEKAREERLKLLRSMALDTDFRSLAAKVEAALREMHHGIPVRYQDGRYLIIHKHRNCEKAIEQGGSESIDLLLPFRPHDFFPKL